MCGDSVGTFSRAWRFNASVLAASKLPESLVNIATVCCNSELSENNKHNDETVCCSESLISLVKCCTARCTLLTVVVAAKLRSVIDVLKHLARSLRHSLKHTQHNIIVVSSNVSQSVTKQLHITQTKIRIKPLTFRPLIGLHQEKAGREGRNVKFLFLFWLCSIKLFSNTELKPNEPNISCERSTSLPAATVLVTEDGVL